MALHESRLTEEAIKAIRDVCAGEVQMHVAKLSGVHQTSISNILNGVQAPSLKTLERILNAFGYDVELKLRKRT